MESIKGFNAGMAKFVGLDEPSQFRRTRAYMLGGGMEATMSYTISYLKSSRSDADEHWKGHLSEAQDLARRSVDDGTCESAEIRDDKGQLLFHYPRALHSANRT